MPSQRKKVTLRQLAELVAGESGSVGRRVDYYLQHWRTNPGAARRWAEELKVTIVEESEP